MASQMSDNPLDQLKPIIFPDHGVSAWPLAPGWWAVIVLLIVGIIAFIFLRPILKNQKKLKAIQANTQELLNQCYAECSAESDTQIAIQNYLQKSNDIFKRVVYREAHLTTNGNLIGQSWVDFILTIDPEKRFATLYGNNIYASSSKENVNLSDLHHWASQLVVKLYKKSNAIGKVHHK